MIKLRGKAKRMKTRIRGKSIKLKKYNDIDIIIRLNIIFTLQKYQ
jgi:hypothetical protein